MHTRDADTYMRPCHAAQQRRLSRESKCADRDKTAVCNPSCSVPSCAAGGGNYPSPAWLRRASRSMERRERSARRPNRRLTRSEAHGARPSHGWSQTARSQEAEASKYAEGELIIRGQHGETVRGRQLRRGGSLTAQRRERAAQHSRGSRPKGQKHRAGRASARISTWRAEADARRPVQGVKRHRDMLHKARNAQANASSVEAKTKT